MGIALEFILHYSQQTILNLANGFAHGNPRAIADPKNVRVYRDGRFSERRVEDHVRGLSTHTR